MRTKPTWRQLCRAGHHRWRGKEHAGGCPLELASHLHVQCRRPVCGAWWLEPMLFDPTPWTVAA